MSELTYAGRRRKALQKKRLFDENLKKKQRSAKNELKKHQKTSAYKPSYDPRIEENKKYKSFTGTPDEITGVKPTVLVHRSLLDNYEDRETRALEEKALKKKRVAIPFNKGAYQYLSDDQIKSELDKIGKK